jgi:hypothetical protein
LLHFFSLPGVYTYNCGCMQVPNGLGTLLGACQLILYGVYYRSTRWDEEDEDEESDQNEEDEDEESGRNGDGNSQPMNGNGNSQPTKNLVGMAMHRTWRYC